MPGFYKTLCLENPRVKDLFVTDYARDALTQPEVISRIEERKKAYCEYNPAFRLCILCKVNLSQIVAQRSFGVLGAYAECKNRLDSRLEGETTEEFERRILAK